MSATYVQIQIRGANVTIIDSQVYASLIPPPNAATWVVTAAGDGTFVFTDQAGGQVLAAPSTDPGTQAVVAPAGAPLQVSSWTLAKFSDEDGDDETQIKDLAELDSGFYTIQDPGSAAFLFRNASEDKSLNPKFVGFPRIAGDGPYELVIQVVGDDSGA